MSEKYLGNIFYDAMSKPTVMRISDEAKRRIGVEIDDALDFIKEESGIDDEAIMYAIGLSMSMVAIDSMEFGYQDGFAWQSYCETHRADFMHRLEQYKAKFVKDMGLDNKEVERCRGNPLRYARYGRKPMVRNPSRSRASMCSTPRP